MTFNENVDDIRRMALEAMAERDALVAHNEALRDALLPIAKAYSDDPGTSDLYDEQPVTITLGDVRRAWRALRSAT